MWWVAWGAICCLGFFTVMGLSIWAVARAGEGHGERDRRQKPIDIATERLAKGEISRQDFEKIRETLNA